VFCCCFTPTTKPVTLILATLSDRNDCQIRSELIYFNRTVRYDWLNQYIFTTIGEVQQAATAWLWTYNNERPNMALGGITPKQKLAMGMPMAA